MFELCKENFPPPLLGTRPSNTKYPLAQLKVGGRPFDAPRDMGTSPRGADRRAASIRGAARNWAKRHDPDAEFMTRLVDEHSVRCWRIK